MAELVNIDSGMLYYCKSIVSELGVFIGEYNITAVLDLLGSTTRERSADRFFSA